MDNAQYVLCTLQANTQPQQQLKLKFTEGEHVSFFIEGDGEAHLTGNLFDISFQNIKIIQKQVKYFLTFKDR
jgi:hypothetical protein